MPICHKVNVTGQLMLMQVVCVGQSYYIEQHERKIELGFTREGNRSCTNDGRLLLIRVGTEARRVPYEGRIVI